MDASHAEIARCLFRESNDALFVFDPRDHHVVDVNPAALRLTGHDKDVVCGLRLDDLFAGADPRDLDRLMTAYQRTGFFHSREGYVLNRETGPPLPVNVSVSRIHTAPEPLGLVVARDISERAHAQELLRASEERYRSLVEGAKVVLWAITPEGILRSLNPAFEEITGWPCSLWVGRRFTELLDPDDVEPSLELLACALRGEPVPARELRVRSASGAMVVVEQFSAGYRLVAGEMVVTGMARDVTAHHRAAEASRRAEAMRHAKETAEAADRARREFLGNISHEIRTPMTAILGFTDVLLGDPRVRVLPADLRDHLETIRSSGAHLLDLINDILDLTKLEMGKLRVELALCSPAQVVGDVALAMRPRAAEKGITLTVDLDPETPTSIRTDPVRFRQVLINLLSNAIKFTAEGGVRLHVGLDRSEGPSPMLRVDVVDTGAGLAGSEIERLFEPFYTSEHPRTREPGTGLGLTISRRLAEMLGGQIRVRSRAGEGSTFTLNLPAMDGDALPAAPVVAPGRDTPSPATARPLGGRLLLAEDNDAIRRYVALRLRLSGTEVVVAGNGRDALKLALDALADGYPFDWILMDVQMPLLDGHETTRQLRDQGYLHPIIALTAYADSDCLDRCLQFGCDAHIAKPVDWDHLLDVLETHRDVLHVPGPPPSI